MIPHQTSTTKFHCQMTPEAVLQEHRLGGAFTWPGQPARRWSRGLLGVRPHGEQGSDHDEAGDPSCYEDVLRVLLGWLSTN